MKHFGLFEGIGGFSFAAKQMGWETLAWCEWNPFGQKVLGYHFPEAEGFGDITKSDFTKYANRIDVLTLGFPCQPFSTAGEQEGENDERYLLPEGFRAIREIKPRWVVAENVYGITSPKFKNVFTEIYSSLEVEGYEVQTYIIPASAVEADHERYRVWFIAHAKCFRQQRQGGVRDTSNTAQNEVRETNWPKHVFQGKSLPHLYEHDNGVSTGLVDRPIQEWRLEANKAMGNAIVPEVAVAVFKTIQQYENLQN